MKQTAPKIDHPNESASVAMLRRIKKQVGVRAAVPLDLIFGQRYSHSSGILMYHRVSPYISGKTVATCNVSPQQLRQQLLGLLSKGFKPLALQEMIQCHYEKHHLPTKSFAVTFDDGYENFYTTAWPILKELKIPVTLFMVTGFLDCAEPFPFDDWTLAGSDTVDPQSWRPLSTEHCHRMLKNDLFQLGSHTHTHRDFRGKLDEFEKDIQQSFKTLNDRFGLTNAPFSFPWGNIADGYVTDAMIQVAKAAGATCALSTESELIFAGNSPYTWGRFTADVVDTPSTLISKLDGWYTTLRNSWLRMRNFSPSKKSVPASED